MRLSPGASLPDRIAGRLTALAKPDAPLGLAFSGGGDSGALLLAAARWADRTAARLHVFIVDHALAAHSAEHAECAADRARALGCETHLLRWSGEKPARGIQNAARQARHRLIADAARAADVRCILTGHTLDDQAETAWMRLKRGGHWRSLAAMRPLDPHPIWPEGRDLMLARPLLTERRAALRDWLAGEQADWIDDPANLDPAYERVRARERLRGLEPAGLAPERLTAVTVRAAALAAAEDRCAAAILQRRAVPHPEGWIALDTAALGQPGAARTLQLAIAAVSGQPRLPDRARCEALTASAAAPDFPGATLAGAFLKRNRDKLVLTRDPGGTLGRADWGAEAARLTLAAGEEAVWDGRFLIRAGAAPGRIVPLGDNRAGLPDAALRALSRLPAPVRRTLPAAETPGGAGAAATPLLGYNRAGPEMISLIETRLAHHLTGVKTAWTGGEGR